MLDRISWHGSPVSERSPSSNWQRAATRMARNRPRRSPRLHHGSLPLGRSRDPTRSLHRPDALGAGPNGTHPPRPPLRRRSNPRSHRFRPRHCQVHHRGPDHPLGLHDLPRLPWGYHRQYRDPAKDQDLGRTWQMVQPLLVLSRVLHSQRHLTRLQGPRARSALGASI